MAELEQTARFAIKLAPAGHVRWALPGLEADLPFHRWLDTHMIAFPGEPDRRCDTVAELLSASGGQAPVALVVEVEARARSVFGDRLLEYLARARRKLRHGPGRRDKYRVLGLVFVLQGKMGTIGFEDVLPGTPLRHAFAAVAVNVAEEDAGATLGRIDRGELDRAILCWVPLMRGGGEQATVDRWVELAKREPDETRRVEYAGLAKVFADKAGCRPVWEKALEGWEMWKSQVIAEWRDEGELKGVLKAKREYLISVLQAHFPNAVPADMVSHIERTADPALLDKWHEAALKGANIEALQALMGTSPGNGLSGG